MSSTPQGATPQAFPARPLALLLLIAACVCFIGLGRLPLLEPDEGRNAEVAREMIVTHDYITPHYDSLTYLDKPAFQFWLIAGSFHCFGISEWAARFPSALLALACVLLVFLMSRAMQGLEPGAGFRAGIILAVSPLFFVFARTVIFDMTLTFFAALALYCFWLNERRETRAPGLDVIAFAAMGIATITKGPVGFLIPLITLAAYYALAGKFRELKKVRWAAGWAVFLAVVLPWFIAVSLRNPDFPKYALWEESLLRFTTGARMHRSQSIFYYIPVYLGGFFPWSFFLIFAGWSWRKSWRALRQPAHQAQLFLLAWVGVVFVFFTISHSKLPGYFLPAVVPLGVLMGMAWQEADHRAETRALGPGRLPGRLPGWMTAGFIAMILAGLLMTAAGWLLRAHGLDAHLAKKMSPSVAAMLQSALFFGGIIVAALGFLGRNLAMRSRRGALRALSFAVVALTIPLLVLRWMAPLRRYFADDSSRQLAQMILDSPERGLPIYGFYYFRTGLPFYLRRPVGLVSTDGGQITSNYVVSRYAGLLRKNPQMIVSAQAAGEPGNVDAMKSSFPLLMDAKDLVHRAHSPGPPFLLMLRNDEVNLALQNAGSMQPLWQAWRYSVWKKQPQ
ncbi:MAG: ArnT family glycosyltransferase [Terriglobia bacterium]